MSRQVVAWGMFATAVAMALIGLCLAVFAGGGPGYQTVIAPVAATASWAALTSLPGLMIARAQPANAVGWLLLGSGIGAALLTLATGAHGVWYATGAPQPGGVWLDVVSQWGLAINEICGLAAIFVFPNGVRPQGRPWVVWLLASYGGIWVLGWGAVGTLFALGTSRSSDALIEASDALAGGVRSIGLALLILILLLIGRAVVHRFRTAAGVARLQLKWLAVATAVNFAYIAFGTVVVPVLGLDESLSGAENVLLQLSFAVVPAFIPVAIGIAIVRHQLFDIDLVVNRTVVLAVLAGFITGVYAVIVVGIGRVVGGSSSLALPIAATAVVAVAFEPVRELAQRWANRVAYGQRATPYEVLSDLTGRLAAAEADDGLLRRMVELLHDGTGAERATVWLGTDGAMHPGATAPEGVGAPGGIEGDSFPVLHDGDVVGALEVVKPRGSSLTPTERSLIQDLAGSAGLVLGHQRLIESLQLRAEELRRSRTRLVEAQDAERRRLERDLHDGAQQQLVALKVQLGVAARLAAGNDDLRRVLTDLGEDAQAAIDEIRSLARGIYPPLLLSDGLKAAVTGLAASVPVPILVDGDGVGRYPADIEAAVYFNVSEAITNAVKHARPPISVILSDDGGALAFEVADAGPGFDPARVNGSSGLRNMVDRMDAVGGGIVIESEPGSGTTVIGSVPNTETVGAR